MRKPLITKYNNAMSMRLENKRVNLFKCTDGTWEIETLRVLEPNEIKDFAPGQFIQIITRRGISVLLVRVRMTEEALAFFAMSYFEMRNETP